MKNKTSGWVFFADKDMLMARAVTGNAELTGGVAFHCQQAIEKFLKAYLSEHDKEVRKTHDLLSLYSEAKNIQDWNLDEDMLKNISDIYIELRYPVNIAMKPDGLLPSIEEAQSYWEFARTVERVFRSLVK
ncbi:MAG: HEPN domain-containing protein [Chitinispirillales bacterium]|jgi:HEPN domain-containing protein|nr:HEPN domain-containing protein [Chitinispirillales bacterium]